MLSSPYRNPQADANPFLSQLPCVMVVRHVRITDAGETVAEDAQALTRFFSRSVNPRQGPQQSVNVSPNREFPDVGNSVKAY